MKIIRNRIIPFKGFAAINLFGVLFVRKSALLSKRMINHEKIHTAQMKEMLYIPFYIWYLIEWVIRLFKGGNAYKNISFEREAYDNEKHFKYLETRKHYAWIKYLKKQKVEQDPVKDPVKPPVVKDPIEVEPVKPPKKDKNTLKVKPNKITFTDSKQKKSINIESDTDWNIKVD